MKKSVDQKVREVLEQNPTWGRIKIAKAVHESPNTVRDALARIMAAPASFTPNEVDDFVLEALQKRAVTPAELANAIGVTTKEAQESISRLREEAYNIVQRGVHVSISKPGFERLPLSITDHGEWTRLGLVSDTHLCCKEERLAELHNQYELFKREGITTVLHAGNIVDGFIPGLNQESVYSPNVDGQCAYVVANYPQQTGIKTYYITGDDHESWFMRAGLNFGKYLDMTLRDAGRDDLQYVGHVEADIEFQLPNGKSTILKLQHPGGGSSYARSYTGQKQVESLEGGEKPAILVQGHYHVSNYMVERNIHVISMPGFQDQTIFARKKRLRMEVGGAILEFKQNPEDGAVTRCRLEFNRYFNRGYYKPFLKSDANVTKGHLTFKKK